VMKSAVPGEFAFMNRELPMNTRLLFLNTNYGFYSEREYIADSFFEASQIVDWLACASAGEIQARLRNKGITHISIRPERDSCRIHQCFGSFWMMRRWWNCSRRRGRRAVCPEVISGRRRGPWLREAGRLCREWASR